MKKAKKTPHRKNDNLKKINPHTPQLPTERALKAISLKAYRKKHRFKLTKQDKERYITLLMYKELLKTRGVL